MKKNRFIILAGIGLSVVLIAYAWVSAFHENIVELPTLSPGVWNGEAVARTRFGDVQGYEDKDDTWVWKAIPFAQPPVGDLRWRAPRDPEPWKGIRRKRSFNGGCTQFGVFGGIRGSEDCLYLNIWRPRNTEKSLPVYVWIHGGGNSIGSATMVADYYGNRLAARSNMVFVSLNYRLGPFGWFTHPALREGNEAGDDSGNFGTLDIIQALKWIHENITIFGGDPNQVIITGESAGGMNVLSMIISPRSVGLFNKAMCQSGLPWTRSVSEGEQKASQVLAQLLVSDHKAQTLEAAVALAATMNPEEIRAYLRSKSDREIMGCFKQGIGGMSDNLAIFRDGYVIPREGYEVLQNGTYPNKVPLIIGSNREEYKMFLWLGRTVPWRGDLYQPFAKYQSELWKASGVDEIARKLSAQPGQPPVYVYEFAWGAPDNLGKSPLPGKWGRKLGAFHSVEIPFFLGNDTVNGFLQLFLFDEMNQPGRKLLSQAMMDYATQFVRTGNPNRTGDSHLPVWEHWSNEPDGPKNIVFDVEGDALDIGMMRNEYTVSGVMASLEKDLQEPVRGQVQEYIRKVNFLRLEKE